MTQSPGSARVPIPNGWEAHKLALRFLVGPRDGGGSTAETMLYVNGSRLQAIDIWHEDAWLPPELLQDDNVSVALRSWMHPTRSKRFKSVLASNAIAVNDSNNSLVIGAD